MRYQEQANSLRQKVELWLSAAGRVENTELLFNGYRVSVWGTQKILKIHNGYGCKTLNIINVNE